ncbi:MAG: hypothetical protein WBF17_27105 [Phycisphaerae bacterium]
MDLVDHPIDAAAPEGSRIAILLASEIAVVDHCLLSDSQLIRSEIGHPPIRVWLKELLETSNLKQFRRVPAVSEGQEVLPGPGQILVKEVGDGYNRSIAGGSVDRFVRTLEGEHLVRMLVEQIEPFAEGGVDFAFGSPPGAAEADRGSLAVGPVDVRDEAALFLSQPWRLSFSSHGVPPAACVNLRALSIINRRRMQDVAAESPQNGKIQRDQAGFGEIGRDRQRICNIVILNNLSEKRRFLPT